MSQQDSSKSIATILLIAAIVWGVNGVYLSYLSEFGPLVFWTADLIQWVLVPAVSACYLASKFGIAPSQYGFNPPVPRPTHFLWGMLSVAAFYPAFFWVRNYTWTALGMPSGFFTWSAEMPDGYAGTAVWMYSAITAGLVESAFFIGLPWLLWSRHIPQKRVLFSLASSVVFSAVHWEQGPHVVAGAFAFGLVACVWYFRSQSLWPVAIGHTVVDLMAFS